MGVTLQNVGAIPMIVDGGVFLHGEKPMFFTAKKPARSICVDLPRAREKSCATVSAFPWLTSPELLLAIIRPATILAVGVEAVTSPPVSVLVKMIGRQRLIATSTGLH